MLLMNNKGNLTHFWVASDFDKFKFIYQVDIKTYSSILLQVGQYWPINERYHFDQNNQDYIVVYD